MAEIANKSKRYKDKYREITSEKKEVQKEKFEFE
jgi:hypothetical protein